MRTFTGLAVAALAAGALALSAPQPAQAQMNKLMDEIKAKVSDAEHAKVIHDRRSAMRQMSGAMKAIGEYAKDGKGSAADAAAAAKKIAGIAKKIPGLFPKGTEMAMYSGATGAKPEIWSMSGDFKEAAENLGDLANKLAMAASAPGADQKAVGGAMGPVGKDGCGGCHKTFRQKLN